MSGDCIAVTGAGGFIGTALLRRLRERRPGEDVVGWVRAAPTHPVDGVRYVTERPDAAVFYHLAGSRGIGPSWDDPAQDLADNVVPTLEVLTDAGGATVVLASSCAVYGEVPMPAVEDGPVRPQSPYGVSKLAGEAYASMWRRERGVDVRIARIGNPYGPGQRRLAVYEIARRALADGAVSLLGTGEEVRDFIHVEDVAAALEAIAAAGEPGGVYNVASGEATSMRELGAHVGEAAGVGGAVQVSGSAEPGKVPVFLPSVDRIRALGFRPARKLREGIEETVAWIARQ